MADEKREAHKLATPETGRSVTPEAGKLVLPEAGKLGVFISYSRDDLAFADQLDVALEYAGFEPKLDRHGIHGAENWREKLGAMIREADTVVFVLSPSSARSEICAWEVQQAVDLGKRIIPVVCRPLEDVPVPPALSALNYIQFFNDPKKPGVSYRISMGELVKVLKTDHGWLREHTRYLQRAGEWDVGGRTTSRLLSGTDVGDDPPPLKWSIPMYISGRRTTRCRGSATSLKRS